MSFGDTIAAAGFAGKLMFDIMPWFGDGNVHRVSRYKSTDPATIQKQLFLIRQAGGKGVRVTWPGPKNQYAHQATIAICMECAEAGMLFSLLLDPHVNGQTGWNTDAGFVAMLYSDCYIPEKYVCDFSTGINFTGLLPSGFSVLANQSGFGWVNAYNGDNVKTLGELQSINKNISMKWPFVAVGFNDAGFPLPKGVSPTQFIGTRDYGHRVWPDDQGNPTLAPRAIDHQAGNFFFDSCAALSLCPSAPYVGMVWNDHDEGAGVEQFMTSFFNIRLGA